MALAGFALTGCPPPSHWGELPVVWTAQTGDSIAAAPAFGDGKVYVGSWDGYEYALDQGTGAQRWRTFLGQQTNPACDTVGVTSSPAVVGGGLYLGGGGALWYALDAATGGVLWTVPTGDPATGHYNWATPAVHNGHAYVGISSLCDSPLVQGKLMRVNLATGQVVNTWDVVPDGQTGGTIWTTPVVDPARNTVFVTTGNRGADSHDHAEAVVAVDATTLAVKDHWSLPVEDPTPDADWGTAPVLFRDGFGRELVTAGNKNGVVYTFLRDDLSAGPIWFRQISQGASGDEPGAGGLYSNAFFDGQRLFYAGGRTSVGGETVEGSVRALNPANGDVIWETALPSKVYGYLTGANGMIVVPARAGLYVLHAATGEVLHATRMRLHAPGRVLGSRLFLGDTSGTMRSFVFPSEPGWGNDSATVARASAVTCATSPHVGSSSRTCRVTLARGCQRLTGLARLLRTARPAQIRVQQARRARTPATLGLHVGSNCSASPTLRAPLAGKALVLPVPKAYRIFASGSTLSVRSSRRVRLRLDMEPRARSSRRR